MSFDPHGNPVGSGEGFQFQNWIVFQKFIRELFGIGKLFLHGRNGINETLPRAFPGGTVIGSLPANAGDTML